jgi:hypothetical protein
MKHGMALMDAATDTCATDKKNASDQPCLLLLPNPPSALPNQSPNASLCCKYKPSTERSKWLLFQETRKEERAIKRGGRAIHLPIFPFIHHSAFAPTRMIVLLNKKEKKKKGKKNDRPTNGPRCPTPFNFDHYRHLAQTE